MTRWQLPATGTVLILTGIGTQALAQAKGDPGAVEYDARLDGYGEGVALPPGSTALTWLLLIALALVCLIGLFKDARRTHLD